MSSRILLYLALLGLLLAGVYVSWPKDSATVLSFYTAEVDAIPKPTPKVQLKKSTKLEVVHPPRITVETIRRVLKSYDSPALSDAESLYELGKNYGIDPAVCLAFFVIESHAGTRGIARETRSVGNIRATPGYVNYRGYRKYASWKEGAEDWYRLIGDLYVNKWNLTTVEDIVPVYAPAADNNNPHRYTQIAINLVSQWRRESGLDESESAPS